MDSLRILLFKSGTFSQESSVNLLNVLTFFYLDTERNARVMKIYSRDGTFLRTKEEMLSVKKALNMMFILDHQYLQRLLEGQVSFDELESNELKAVD